MKASDLPLAGKPGQFNELRIQIARAITKAELDKTRGGAGAASESLATELSALFAAAKVATDAVIAAA